MRKRFLSLIAKWRIPNTFYRVSVKAIIWNDTRTKFLLAQEKNGMWETPGGGLNWGEHVAACITRELHEEMGLSVIKVSQAPIAFIPMKELFDSRYPYRGFVFYEVQVRDYAFVPSDECRSIGWFTPEEAMKLAPAYPNIHDIARLISAHN
ncbi:MAG: hypothetical protein RI911_867 [Candidatus Parcubacteria bacterium]|jgi:8-oxo-dGTP diphosphatase